MTFKPKQLDKKVVKMFSESEVGIMLEHIDDRLGVIIEGQEDLKGRVGKLETKVDVLADTVGEMKVEMTEMNGKLDRKPDQTQIKVLERRVATLETK